MGGDAVWLFFLEELGLEGFLMFGVGVDGIELIKIKAILFDLKHDLFQIRLRLFRFTIPLIKEIKLKRRHLTLI